MNRIILIGNGFDLAHEMKTSYRDFLNYYWSNIAKEISGKRGRFENDDVTISFLYQDEFKGGYIDILKKIERNSERITINNRFLKVLTERNYIHNWVDVEAEYYRLLKEIITKKNKYAGNETYTIDKLNKELNDIKCELVDYLISEELKPEVFNSERIKNIRVSIFNNIFELIDYDNQSEETFSEIISPVLDSLIVKYNNRHLYNQSLNEHELKLCESIFDSDQPIMTFKNILRSNKELLYQMFKSQPDNILLLNFNYTNTHDFYIKSEDVEKYSNSNVSSINIHGSLYKQSENPIIFGFGDELDKEYKVIENLEDNRYLENIKSINYLEANNYKRLLQYIESDYYEVYIFGHSCGNSDRTLLNTLFEHDNCASIKVFYHQREDGSDNYSDIVRNISRNFSDKAKMRDRVVNKTMCEPLVGIKNN